MKNAKRSGAEKINKMNKLRLALASRPRRAKSKVFIN
jgi:hypothetical protein